MMEMGCAFGKAKASISGRGGGFIPDPKLNLPDQVSEVMRFKEAHHGRTATRGSHSIRRSESSE